MAARLLERREERRVEPVAPDVPGRVIMAQDGHSVERLQTQLYETLGHSAHLRSLKLGRS